MEFNFDVQGALRSVASAVQQNDVMIIHGDRIKNNSAQIIDQVRQVVDAMGQASGKAQKLPSTITTLGKLQANQHILIIKAQGNKAIGFLKVGYKQLFVRGRGGEMHEMKPLAVLDFYVDAQVQRGGYGKALFDIMLAYMGSKPALIAYDRPSHKLMGFLGKHFNLRNYVPQNNNYVVFDDYFSATAELKDASKSAAQQQPSPPQETQTNFRAPLVRQSTQQLQKEDSIFGQSHMGSFQQAQPNSQMNTVHGGWTPAPATSSNEQHRTHYPRASHHNQSFRIGEAYPNGGAQTVKQYNESLIQSSGRILLDLGEITDAHIRTQANTFAINSNSIASNSSQIFEQTQSSNGFGSNFMSSSGQQPYKANQIFRQQNLRSSQVTDNANQQGVTVPAPRYSSKSGTASSTQMKFGTVGQELLNNSNQSATGQENHLQDFKQSFTKINFQRQQQNQQINQQDASLFQTSYQSQFAQKEGKNAAAGQVVGAETSHSRGSGLFGTQQPGYSHFMAFANRQQSLPVPQNGQTGSAQGASQHHYQMQSRHSEKHYAATFQGNTAAGSVAQQMIQGPQSEYKGYSGTGGHSVMSPQSNYQSKAYSMPARSIQAQTALAPGTQRLLQQNSLQQHWHTPSTHMHSNSLQNQGSNRLPTHSAKVQSLNRERQYQFQQQHAATLSPVNGSKAAQFLQHQHLFQGQQGAAVSSSAALQRPLAGPNNTISPQQQFTSIWQSHEHLSSFKPTPVRKFGHF